MYPRVCAYKMLIYMFLIYNLNTYTYGLLKCFDLILYMFKIEIIENSYSLSHPPPKNNIKKREELMSRKIIKLHFYFNITDRKIGF